MRTVEGLSVGAAAQPQFLLVPDWGDLIITHKATSLMCGFLYLFYRMLKRFK